MSVSNTPKFSPLTGAIRALAMDAVQQAIDLAGQPTDQGAYITGKAWIPFYFGSDRARWEMAYKGKGRLIFSQNAGFGTDFYLTWIIHTEKDTGYR